jgi:hypothetical protein
VLGFAAILLVFRTTDWRSLMREAHEDSERAAPDAAMLRPQPPK